MNLEALRARLADLQSANEKLVAACEADGRELTEQEAGDFDGRVTEIERVKANIARVETVIHNAAPAPRKVTEGARAPQATVPAQARTNPGTAGFRHFGEFAQAVQAASRRGAEVDSRLMAAAATSISQESVGADGGFAVPPDFRDAIMSRVFGEDSLVARCDQQTCSGNTWTAPMDETTPWGTGGVKAFFEAEAAAITQSRLNLRQVTVRLNKLACLVPVTEELLEDSGSVDGYLRSRMPMAIDWELSSKLVYGTGAGEPLGIMNSPALVTQAAEGGQAADTLVAANIVKMYARMPVNSRRNAVWLIHPDVEPQLHVMTLGGTAQAFPVYLPPGGLSAAPYGTLMGRPVIPHQACETIGDLGDIMFVDFSQYLAVRKGGGLRLSTSIHLWFDQDITAFKATMRIGGQPWWSAPIAQRDGSNTQSPFVTLAAR